MTPVQTCRGVARDRRRRSVGSRISTADDSDIDIDASAVDGRISPLLYGQFIEFMFEGVKYGLHAEMHPRPRLRGGT